MRRLTFADRGHPLYLQRGRSVEDARPLFYSGIGDRLKDIIARQGAAERPCSECWSEINRLNGMTASQVLADMQGTAERIVLRARHKAQKWYQRAAATVAPSLLLPIVEAWILEAIGVDDVTPRPAPVPANMPLQFLWCYWHAGARGDELRWSMRSVRYAYGGAAEMLVIGDRPAWYSGPVIQHTRQPADENPEYKDMLAKMQIASRHKAVQDRFVWMMDDVYLLRKVTAQELGTPRAAVWREQSGNRWQNHKTHTMQRLAAAGRQQHDYATHAPHLVEKDLLRQLWDMYPREDGEIYLWELLYGNTFRERPQPIQPFLRILRHPCTQAEIAEATRQAAVLNHHSSVWGAEMRAFLAERFPAPTEYEEDQ